MLSDLAREPGRAQRGRSVFWSHIHLRIRWLDVLPTKDRLLWRQHVVPNCDHLPQIHSLEVLGSLVLVGVQSNSLLRTWR